MALSVTVGERFEKFVKEQVASGRYNNVSEVVREFRRHNAPPHGMRGAAVHQHQWRLIRLAPYQVVDRAPRHRQRALLERR